MHSLPVFTVKGKKAGRISLPVTFSRKVEKDLIKRAVLAEVSRLIHPYGSDPLAGQRSSAHYHGMRHRIDTHMNREMARMKRIHGQGFLNRTARVVPQAVKGRRAHPPKIGKIWEKKMNKRERMEALASALSATLDRDMVSERGHSVDGALHVPLVIEDKLHGMSKTSDAVKVLDTLGLGEEMKRCRKRPVRSGKGTLRGRKRKTKRGPLVVVGKDDGIVRALRNVPGVDVALVKDLDVSSLAPGTHAGRLAIFTESAIKELDSSGKGKAK